MEVFPVSDVPQKNTTGEPREVPDDVVEKQDPEYSPADFDRDLEKATRRREGPSAPDPESPRR